jgi:hypothetical protein
MNKVALGQIFLQVLPFTIPLLLQIHLLLPLRRVIGVTCEHIIITVAQLGL